MSKNIITSNNELTFTKNYDFITSSTKLSPLDKLLIARVLNWQQSNKTCTLSNSSLAKELGTPLSTVKQTITKLNKTTFFKSVETSKFNEFNTWSNSKEISIDEQALIEFLNIEKKVVESRKKIIEIKEPNEPIAVPKAIECNDEPIKKETSTEASKIDLTDTFDIKNEFLNEDFDEVEEETFFEMIKRTGYSTTEFNSFKIPNYFIEYWSIIEGQKGSINNLRKSNSQFNFDYELKRIIESNSMIKSNLLYA